MMGTSQDYRGRLPAAQSWATYLEEEEESAEKEGGHRSGDDQYAWLANTTASLRRVDPDSVQSGEMRHQCPADLRILPVYPLQFQGFLTSEG